MTLSKLPYTSAASFLTLAAIFSAALFSNPACGQQAGEPVLPDAPYVALASAPALSDPASGLANAGYSTSADPDAAQTSPQSSTTIQKASAGDDQQDKQTKRILGIIPNFRSVSANQKLPPQSVKEKFVTAAQDSFDYSSVVVPALLAGFDQARDATPEFRQGAIGYGRYFWHSFVDQTDENLWVEFIVPAIAHEDTRYYTLGDGGFKKRAVYAIKHVVVTRNDAGKNVFNSGEVLGAGIAAGISNLYYPSPERTAGNTIEQWGTSLGIDTFTFAFREFWPDINHKLFHGSKP